jgi:hypothetical protein
MNSFRLSEEIQEIARLAAHFGKNWSWVEEYLHCFQPALDKPLKAARMKIVLDDILRFIEQGGFNIEKHWYVVRPNAIYDAVRYVAQTNKTGFKNHNYMKKVAIDFNQKIIQKEEAEQRGRAQEAQRRDAVAPEKIRKMIEGIGLRLGEPHGSERR